MLYEAIIAAFAIALLSLCGSLVFSKSHHMKGTHRFIVPIAIGTFLSVIFFELIPETLEAQHFLGSVAIIVGFLSFYLLSHLLRSYHHHHDHHEHGPDCSYKNNVQMLLLGDAVHNIADGVVIATAFLINPAVGVVTTLGIALHEIPQEIAEYGVLISAGYTKKKALIWNFISASTIVLGVGLSYLFLQAGNFTWILTGLAAGNLLYIVASDMIPELNDKHHSHHFMQTFISTLIGLIAMTSLIYYSHELFEEQHDEEQHESIKIAV